MPFPHRPLVSGEDAQCRWTTGYISAATPRRSLDPIQLAAYSEGVCVPDGLDSALHVFSTAEAIECLNSTEQGRVISVTVCGDSYTRQLFIGLADVLLGRPSDEQITTQARRLGLLAESNERLAHLHGNDTSFPDVQYPMECFGECYGKYSNAKAPFSVRCSGCVNDFTSRSEDAVGVVGAGVHNLWYFGERVRERMRRNGEEAVTPLVARDEASGETAESVNETIRDGTSSVSSTCRIAPSTSRCRRTRWRRCRFRTGMPLTAPTRGGYTTGCSRASRPGTRAIRSWTFSS